MTTKHGSKGIISAATLLAVFAGVAVGGDLDPSGQAGQYNAERPAVRIKGTTGEFAPSTVHVPFILLNDPTTGAASTQSLFNAAVVENVGGRAVGAVTTFGADATSTVAPRVVAILGSVDGDPLLVTGTSNNVILSEGAIPFSNTAGSILPDGTLVCLERFSTFPFPTPPGGPTNGQNNVGYWNDVLSVGVAEPIQAPLKIFANTVVNIGNVGETNVNAQTADIRGQVQVGTPIALRDPNVMNPVNDNDLITAVTHFNGNPALTAAQRAVVSNGVHVYRGGNLSPTTVLGPSASANCVTNTTYPYIPETGAFAWWLQSNVPTPTNPAGECRTDARQTQPVAAAVRTPGGRDVIYQVHGIGFSGTSPFTGGSARVLYLAVDAITGPDGSPRTNYVGSNAVKSTNTILIEADAVGGEGSTHGRPYDATAPLDAGFADHFNSNLSQKFVDKQATGGGAGPSTNSQFDMNSAGQIVALWVDESQSPQRYEVRLYEPIWDNVADRIEGYNLAKVVSFNGDLDNNNNPYVVAELKTTIESLPGTFIETRLAPFSGIAIDDDGRVAFTATMEKFETVGDFDNNKFTDDTIFLNNTTNGLFVYEPTTDSLHLVLEGGQNGDVFEDAFPASGNPNNERIELGFFPVDTASDGFSRDSFSKTGGFLAVNFRSGGNQFVNGVNQELEFLPDGFTPDTFIDRGGVLARGSGATLNERAARGVAIVTLGAFDDGATPVCCIGNADKILVAGPDVTFADITAVLGNFNAPANPNGTSVGDANCDGFINFADITAVLSSFNTDCE